jgi:hypothetical protein
LPKIFGNSGQKSSHWTSQTVSSTFLVSQTNRQTFLQGAWQPQMSQRHTAPQSGCSAGGAGGLLSGALASAAMPLAAQPNPTTHRKSPIGFLMPKSP